MTPFAAVVTPALALITKAIELRMEHYKVNPELRKQDAENAAIWGRWGNGILKAIERLFAELGVTPDP